MILEKYRVVFRVCDRHIPEQNSVRPATRKQIPAESSLSGINLSKQYSYQQQKQVGM